MIQVMSMDVATVTEGLSQDAGIIKRPGDTGADSPSEKGGKNHESPLSNTYQKAHSEAGAVLLREIRPETKNTIVHHFNQFCQMTERLEREDSRAFRNEPLYAEALKIWKAHAPDFHLSPTPEASETANSWFQLVKKVVIKETPKEVPDKQAPVEAAGFDPKNFTDEERIVIEGVLRLAARQLAHAVSVDIPNANIPIRTTEFTSTGEYSLISKDKPAVPERFTLLDKRGYPVRSPASLDELRRQFLRLPNTVNTAYAEAIGFNNPQLYTEQQRLLKVAELHNATITLRESITGLKPTRAFGVPTRVFGRDLLSVEIMHQSGNLLNERFHGKTFAQLTPQERSDLEQAAISRAVVALGGRAKEIVTEHGVEKYGGEHLVAIAKQRADAQREVKVERIVYKKVNKNTDGSTTIEDSDAAKYNNGIKIQQDKQAKVTQLTTERTTLEQRIQSITQELESAERDPKYNKTALNIQLEVAQEQLNAFPVDFKDKTMLKEYIDNLKSRITTIQPKLINKTTQTTENLSPEAYTHLTALSNKYNELVGIKIEAKLRLKQLTTLEDELNAIHTQLTENDKKIQKAQTSLTYSQNTEYKKETQTQTPEAVGQIDFIVGHEPREEGEQKIPSFNDRLNHVGETFFNGKSRDGALSSWDNYRAMLFGVEGDLKGQEMARTVLPDEILTRSLSLLLEIPPQDCLDSLYQKNPQWIFEHPYAFVAEDGTFNWEHKSIAIDLTTKPALMEIVKQTIMDRMRTFTPSTNTMIAMGVLNERLRAASEGKPTEWSGFSSNPSGEEATDDSSEAGAKKPEQNQNQNQIDTLTQS